MSVATLVGSFDDIVRSTSVLAEGIEGGLCYDSLFAVLCVFIVLLAKQEQFDLYCYDFLGLNRNLSSYSSFLASMFPNL